MEADRRAVDIPWDYMVERELGRTERRAEAVAANLEEQYASGDGTRHFKTDKEITASAILGGDEVTTVGPAHLVVR